VELALDRTGKGTITMRTHTGFTCARHTSRASESSLRHERCPLCLPMPPAPMHGIISGLECHLSRPLDDQGCTRLGMIYETPRTAICMFIQRCLLTPLPKMHGLCMPAFPLHPICRTTRIHAYSHGPLIHDNSHVPGIHAFFTL